MEETRNPTIRGYRILHEIDKGGMGIVYLASPELDPERRVAIKLLHAGVLLREKEVVRFGREGKFGQRLEHPHLLPVLESGECDGIPYLITEYVQGRSLRHRIAERRSRTSRIAGWFGPDSAEELVFDLRIIRDVARALDHAHGHGLIHRDIKPANILVREDGHSFLIDFGLARELGEGSSLTSSGVVVGTPWYMSPEQLVGDTHRVGPASDVYALGVTLYETLSGRRPFQAGTFEQQRSMVLEKEPLPLTGFRGAAGIEPIVFKALEKSPDHRYATAGEMAQDIERVLMGMEPKAKRMVLQLRKTIRGMSRQRMRAAALSVLLLACAVVWFWWAAHARTVQASDLEIENHFLAAETALDEGDDSRALKEFQGAIDRDPDRPEGYLRRADGYERLGRSQLAREDLLRAEKRGFSLAEPTSALSWFHKGLYLKAKGNRGLAAESLKHSVAIDPTLYRAYLVLFQIEIGMGKKADARRHLEFYRQDFKQRNPHSELIDSDLLALDDRMEEAKQVLLNLRRRMGSASPAFSAQVSRRLGRVYARLEQREVAESELRDAIAFDERDVGATVNLGIVLLEEYQSQPDSAQDDAAVRSKLLEALDCGTRALAVDHSSTSACELSGQALYLLGSMEDALRVIDAGLRISPDNLALRGLRSWITFKEALALGEHDDIFGEEQMLYETLAVTPDHFGALLQLALDTWGTSEDQATLAPAAYAWLTAARGAWADLNSRREDVDAKWQVDSLGKEQEFKLLVSWFGLARDAGYLDEASEAKSAVLFWLNENDQVDPHDITNFVYSLTVNAPDKIRDCSLAGDLIRQFDLESLACDDADVRLILEKSQTGCRSVNGR